MLTTSCRPGWRGSPAPGARFRPASRALLPMSPRRFLAACVLLSKRVCGHPGAGVSSWAGGHSPMPRHVCPSHGGRPSIERVRATAASRVDAHLDLHLVTEEGGEAHITVAVAPRRAEQSVEGRAGGRQGSHSTRWGLAGRAAKGWPWRGTAWPRHPQLPCTPPPCSQTGGRAAHGLPRRPLWPLRVAGSSFLSGDLTVRTQARCVSP